MLLTKNKKKQIEGIDFNKTYPVIEAVKLLKEKKFVKFDESIEVSINTGIDSKQSDQNVRGSFVPPHGLGKKFEIAERRSKDHRATYKCLAVHIKKLRHYHQKSSRA